MENVIWDLINSFNPLVKELNEAIVLRYKQIAELEKELSELSKDKTTELDEYCKSRFKEIPMIAYSQKRSIKGKPYNIFLNELITHNSCEVQHFFKEVFLNFSVNNFTTADKAKEIGDKVASSFTWTDDKNLSTSGDYYLSPNESIALKYLDCEDHSFVVSSASEDIGCAWGFYGTTGHCFNVFVEDGELYVLETTGDKAEIFKYKDSNYKINYIITREHAYQVDGSKTFGQNAGWE